MSHKAARWIPQYDRQRMRQLCVIWLSLRVFTSLWAALISAAIPFTTLEKSIPLWPPSLPLNRWLERTLLDPWLRWDATHYVNIVRRGYHLDDGSAQFHPLFAWLAMPVAWLSGSPMLGLMVVSSIAGVLALIAFEACALLDLTPRHARWSMLLLVCSPVACILFAPYTEGLFLLWSILCLLWARQGAYWLAGLAGALATLTRQQGVFLLLPLAWEIWEISGRDWRKALADWRRWLSLTFIPFGFIVWIIYRALVLNDFNADLSSPQHVIYSVLISPSSEKVVPVQKFLWPWHALWLAFVRLSEFPEVTLIIDLVQAAAFIYLLALAWHNMRMSYRIYALTITLVSFSYHTGPLFPYMGLPRHLMLAFPIFIGLGPAFAKYPSRMSTLTLGLIGMMFLIFQYQIESWVP